MSETEKAFSSNPLKGKETVKRIKSVGQFIAEATPIIGDAIAVNEIAEELKKDSPNWYLVGALGGASILGLIPGVGDAAANLVKKGTRRALDIASRIEIDVATVGMNAGNVRIKPKDIIKKDADGLDKIKKILDKEKNLDDNYYIVHGGMDFEGPLDLKYSGKGEQVTIRPLGRGIYGYMFNPKSSTSIKEAYEGTQNYAIHFGSSTSESWLGFKNPLYREAFKSADLPPKTSEEMLKKLHKEVPMKRTVKNLGKVHLIKIPKNKLERAVNKTSHKIKVFDNEEQLAKNVNTNYEVGTIPGFQYDRKPQYLGDPFAFKGNNFGDAQLVSENFEGQRNEVSILDTSIAEVLGKVNIDKDVFDNLPVDKKKDFLKDRVTVDYDKEKLDASIKRRKLDYYAPKIVEGEARKNPVVSPSKGKQVDFSEFPYRLDDSNIDDIELARENIGSGTYFPKEEVFGETGRKIKRNIPKDYNKGGTTMNRQMNMAFMQEGGMKDDGMDKDPVSGNNIPAGSMAKEVRDDIPAQLSEGEYVVPADVVQYYGVKFFEDLRMQAKMGLAQMDRDGRIGGEPVAVTAVAIEGGKKQLDSKDEKKLMEILGEPVKADEGVLTDADYHQAAQTSLNTDPTSGFQYSGQSLSQPFSQMQRNVPVTTMETWYHPDGMTQIVQLVNGQVTPPEMIQYTQPPWSKDASVTIKPKKDKDREPPKLIPKVIGSETIRMTQGNYDALVTSAGKIFGKTADGKVADGDVAKYYNLPFATRIALLGQEFKKDGADSDEVDKIIEETKDGFSLDKLFEFGKKLFVLTPPGMALELIKSVADAFTTSKENTGGGTSSSDNKESTLPKFVSSGSSKEAEGKSQKAVDALTKASEGNLDKYQAKGKTGTTAQEKFGGEVDAFGALNKGGLLTKPKRKPKKPRGKGLASR